MKQILKILRVILIILTLLLSLTAIPGGIMLLVNFYAPPVEQLQGSIFKDFTIPGLALSLIVGGSALIAAFFLLRKSKFGALFAAVAGVIIIFFEFVEVLIIGSPAGASQVMQIGFAGLGVLILVASLGIWFIDIVDDK